MQFEWKINKGVVFAVLTFLFSTVFLSTIPAATQNANAKKDGYHLEVYATKSKSVDASDAVDVTCMWTGLNPTAQELKNSIKDKQGLVADSYVEDYTVGGINDTVTHKRLVIVMADGREFTLAGPYVDANNGWAGYAYYILHFAYADEIHEWCFVGSEHYWLGTTNGDAGMPEVHDSVYNYTYTLYDFVPNDYTVQYDGNGEDSGSVKNQSCTYDESFTTRANKFVRAGYTFTGWNTKANGSGTSYDAKTSVKNLTKTKDATVTLYAQWEVNSGSITYHANGGTIADAPHLGGSKYYKLSSSIVQSSATATGTYEATTKTVKYTSSASDLLSPNTPNLSKTGYHIETGKEWNTKTDGSGSTFDQAVDYDPKEYFSTLATKTNLSMVMYANWKINTYTIAYNGNGATAGSVASQTATYNVALALSSNAFARTGYEFNGWNTAANGSGTAYTPGASIKNLTTTNNATVTLYAQWKAVTYTIHFDGNGATAGSMADLTATIGKEATLPVNRFTRVTEQGQSLFLGWSLTAEATAAAYTDQSKVQDLTNQPQTTVTLYAIWDDCPDIQATDLYYTLEEAQSGFITEDELLSHATAYDRELKSEVNPEGEVNPGIDEAAGTSFHVWDYLSEDFTSFIGDGSVTETYHVTDGVGNVKTEMITVYVVDTSAKPVEEGKVRFISEKYLNTLSDDSIWKTNSDYSSELTAVLSNHRENVLTFTGNVLGKTVSFEKEGTGTWVTEPEQIWQFSHADVLAVQAYIEEHGPGNIEEANALSGFIEQFGDNRIK